MPHFRYLHIDDFCAQLDYFKTEYGFVGKEEFIGALEKGETLPPGVILTFDDGFRDHINFVLPELRQRGLWGIFFIPTGIYTSGKILSVHRVHHLLGRYGGKAMIEVLQHRLSGEMLSHKHVTAYRDFTYQRQDNDAATDDFKRILNYYITPRWQEAILDSLMSEFFDEGMLLKGLYMSLGEVRILQDEGMLIGSHSVSHPLFSNLSIEDQRRETFDSFDFLEHNLDRLPLKLFCYPYGGLFTFSTDTENLLIEAGCRFAFTTEQREVQGVDLHDRPLALPRYDCNQFVWGQASKGSNRPMFQHAIGK